MVKQGVGRNFHLVEVDVGIVRVHADRRSVADEMDVVAASGKFLAEFGGDDAGTAVGGIASYADSHDRFRHPTRFDYVTRTVRMPCGTKHPMLESRPFQLSVQERP